MFGSLKKWYRNHREVMTSVTDDDIIELALESRGKITVAALAAQTKLSNTQANMKLSAMHSRGIFHMNYDTHTWTNLYVLKHPEMYRNIRQKKEIEKKNELSDADLIKVALAAKGRLTPMMLCLRADIDIEAAEERLRKLQRKGVFDLEVGNDGAIIYILTEYDTLRSMLDEDQMV